MHDAQNEGRERGQHGKEAGQDRVEAQTFMALVVLLGVESLGEEAFLGVVEAGHSLVCAHTGGTERARIKSPQTRRASPKARAVSGIR